MKKGIFLNFFPCCLLYARITNPVWEHVCRALTQCGSCCRAMNRKFKWTGLQRICRKLKGQFMQQKHSPFVKSEYLHIYLASVYQTQSKTDFKFPLIDSLMLVPFKLASYLTKLTLFWKTLSLAQFFSVFISWFLLNLGACDTHKQRYISSLSVKGLGSDWTASGSGQ